MLSKTPGAPAIGAVRREREAVELAAIKGHPAVRALLEAFPDAKIADIRRMAGSDLDGASGDGEFGDESKAV